MSTSTVARPQALGALRSGGSFSREATVDSSNSSVFLNLIVPHVFFNTQAEATEGRNYTKCQCRRLLKLIGAIPRHCMWVKSTAQPSPPVGTSETDEFALIADRRSDTRQVIDKVTDKQGWATCLVPGCCRGGCRSDDGWLVKNPNGVMEMVDHPGRGVVY